MQDRNIEWFHENRTYQEYTQKFAIYRFARQSLERELRHCQSLLDIGNGGFFNYNVSGIPRVVALDLFVDSVTQSESNVTAIAGDALSFSLDERFDCVVMQNLIHHVTGKSPEESVRNMEAILANGARHLATKGKIVLMESTVPEWFYACEKLAFRLLYPVWRFPHPLTLQHTSTRIMNAAHKAGLAITECSFVPKGRWVLQFGLPFPSVLTPIQFMKLVLVPARNDSGPQ